MKILNVKIDQITRKNALKQCLKWLQESQPPKLLFTPNPEIIVQAQSQPDFKFILNQADLALPDGVGIVWASHGKISERVTGADIMTDLLAEANTQQLTIGIVLPANGLSSQLDVIRIISTRYPQINCSVTFDEFSTAPQIVFVALGAPLQEHWAIEHKNFSGTKIIMTVGAGIDYLTGKQHRAPVFLQSLKLEWLWRLITQPRRFKRIITATIIFPYLVLLSHYRAYDCTH